MPHVKLRRPLLVTAALIAAGAVALGGSTFAETAPTGVDEAYAIQDDVATLTGAAGRE